MVGHNVRVRYGVGATNFLCARKGVYGKSIRNNGLQRLRLGLYTQHPSGFLAKNQRIGGPCSGLGLGARRTLDPAGSDQCYCLTYTVCHIVLIPEELSQFETLALVTGQSPGSVTAKTVVMAMTD